MIKGKTPEEIRKLFNIVNDFTPEEEVRLLSTMVDSCTLNLVTGANQERECELRSFDPSIVADDLLKEWAEDR